MGTVSTLAGILGLSLASGVNLYLSVLLVGLAERLHWVSGLPPELQVLASPVVLASAGLLFLVEFLADKIPFVTMLWDGLHTFIRPIGGALLALAAAGRLDPTLQVLAVLAGGSLALGAHGTKMGVRVLAHATPEPATHGLISLSEDVGVVGMLALAYSHPYLALPILLAAVVAIALLVPRLFRTLNFLQAALAGRVHAWGGQAGRSEVPGWVESILRDLDPAGGTQAIRAFARKVKGVGRFKQGFLAFAGGRWRFISRGPFGSRAVAMDAGRNDPMLAEPGSIWDSLTLLQDNQPQVFFLPKDGSGRFMEGDKDATTRLAGPAGPIP